MSRGEKRLEEMRANPAGDRQIDDVGVVCRAFGIGLAAPRSGGSHYKVTHHSQNSTGAVSTRVPRRQRRTVRAS